jgi:hypothetical protein
VQCRHTISRTRALNCGAPDGTTLRFHAHAIGRSSVHDEFGCGRVGSRARRPAACRRCSAASKERADAEGRELKSGCGVIVERRKERAWHLVKQAETEDRRLPGLQHVPSRSPRVYWLRAHRKKRHSNQRLPLDVELRTPHVAFQTHLWRAQRFDANATRDATSVMICCRAHSNQLQKHKIRQ